MPRFFIIAALALPLASHAQSGGLPDSFTITNPNGARFVFMQPAPAKCKGATCTLQSRLSVPPTATPPQDDKKPKPTPETDPAVAEKADQYIDQAYEFMFEAMQGGVRSLASAGIDYDTLYGLMSPTASASGPTLNRDAQGRVVSRVGSVSGSARRSGVPTDVCAAIAAKALPGIGCSGGVVTSSLTVTVTEYFVESNGTVRDYLSMPPVNANFNYAGLTFEQMLAATPLSGNQFGVVAGL